MRRAPVSSRLAAALHVALLAAAAAVTAAAAGAAEAPAAAPFAPTPFLPALLGADVPNAAAWWSVGRPRAAALVQEYLLGTLPASPPPLVAAVELNGTALPGGGRSSFVQLDFDTASGANNVSFVVEVLRPALPAGGRVPLFLTQATHRAWALHGLGRGWAAIVYPGADGADAAPAFQRAYAGRATMALIAARAFVASRALDYALSDALGFVDASRVAIAGHSRNGKQSLVAAAFDERIGAVLGSSPGSPVATPFRFASNEYYGQDAVTSGAKAQWFSWWAPRCRSFVGREGDMPTDGHAILAMVAPRAAAIATGWQDSESDMTFGNEANVAAAREVYALLGAEGNVSMRYRPGDHHGYIDVPSYFDFFETSFRDEALRPKGAAAEERAGGQPPAGDAFLTPVGFSWDAWRERTNASQTDAPPSSAPLEQRVAWLLDRPAVRAGAGALSVPGGYCEEAAPGEYVTTMMRHDKGRTDARFKNLTAAPFAFGEYVSATAYYAPVAAAERGGTGLPVVIWLHGLSYNRGFDAGGNNTDAHLALANEGFLVLAFDMLGFGMRVTEGGDKFYRRFGGRASLLGRHLGDTLDCLEAALCLTTEARAEARCHPLNGFGWKPTALEAIPPVDAARVFVGGYSLGGAVALHAAALDARFAGAFAVSAFTPMRLDAADRPTGGLRRLSHMHALVPRLGLYVGDERAVPYDYDELLERIAPRPLLLVAPTRDRYATASDVLACVREARSAWGKYSDLLELVTPADHTRLSPNVTDTLVRWAVRSLATPPVPRPISDSAHLRVPKSLVARRVAAHT